MAVPGGGVDQCRQPLPAGLLHDHVQRSGMVSLISGLHGRTRNRGASPGGVTMLQSVALCMPGLKMLRSVALYMPAQGGISSSYEAHC